MYLKDILIDKNLLFNFSNDIPLIDFVKQDEQLTKIANDITYLVFYNSPLDILSNIYSIILKIKKFLLLQRENLLEY